MITKKLKYYVTNLLSNIEDMEINFENLKNSPISVGQKSHQLAQLGHFVFSNSNRLNINCKKLIDGCINYLKVNNAQDSDYILKSSNFNSNSRLSGDLQVDIVGKHLCICSRALRQNPDKFKHYSDSGGDHSFRVGAPGSENHEEYFHPDLDGSILQGSKTHPVDSNEQISSESHKLLATQQSSELSFADGNEQILDLFLDPSRYPILPGAKLSQVIRKTREPLENIDGVNIDTPYVPLTGIHEQDSFLNRLDIPISFRFFLHNYSEEKFYTLRPPIPDFNVNYGYLTSIAQNLVEKNFYLDFLYAPGLQILCSPLDMVSVTTVLISLKFIKCISPQLIGKVKAILLPVLPATLPEEVVDKISINVVLGRDLVNGETLLIKDLQKEPEFEAEEGVIEVIEPLTNKQKYQIGANVLTTRAPRSTYIDVGNYNSYRKIYNFFTSFSVED